MSERLKSELVLNGYCSGMFPMGSDSGEVYWYSPDPRCVFEYAHLKISRSLRKVIRRGVYEVRVNTAFPEVIAACAKRPEGTWISRDIIRTYTQLHHRGYVHSVESWQDGLLVGGLYGVAIGAAFFGESMFHRATDASKVALVALMERLKLGGYTLVDTQWSTPHLLSLGAVEIPRAAYLHRLKDAIQIPCQFSPEAPITHANLQPDRL